MTRPRRSGREQEHDGASVHRAAPSANPSTNYGASPSSANSKKPCAASGPDKMGGLPLPDVVRELLRDQGVLRWDLKEGVYEVLDGDEFERRFNDLRKVRSKVKASGTERPFSRMYNFYVLEHGDKWARTGTKFRPRCETGQPTPEILAAVRQLSSPSAPVTPRTPMSASSSGSRQVSPPATMATAAPAIVSKREAAPPASPRISARPHSSLRAGYEVEVSRPRSRDAPFHHRAAAAPAASSHVRAPPASPRHQPQLPPAAAAYGARVLGKRPVAAEFDDRDMAPQQRARLSDQIYRTFKHHGIAVEPHRSSSQHSPTAASASPRIERYPFGSPTAYRDEHAYAKMQHMQAPFATHAHGDFATHDLEGAQAAEQARASDMEFVQVDMYQRAPSPIEIDDASSGFPSPECLLAIEGDFVGSPLDLGDPELPLFGLEDDGFGGTSGRDHSLLKPFECQNEEEAWETLRAVMW